MIRIDIEMPKTCYECPFAMHSYETLYVTQGNNSCVLTHKTITSTKRNRFCPLRELVCCKDCKHRPTGDEHEHDLVFPNDVCPCQCDEDYWYSWKPKDDWFCPKGEKGTK